MYYLCFMIEYTVDSKTYSFSYQGLRNDYHRFCEMTDKEFLENLPAALHFACYTAWIKEMTTDASMGEGGILHNLIHWLHIPDEKYITDLTKVREQFREVLRLC